MSDKTRITIHECEPLKVSVSAEQDLDTSLSEEQILNINLNADNSLESYIYPKGDPGRGIVSIEKVKTEGSIDTYMITYTDKTYSFFTVTNGLLNEDINYEKIKNLPLINDITLIGNKSLDELNIQVKGDYPKDSLSNQDIENIINKFI